MNTKSKPIIALIKIATCFLLGASAVPTLGHCLGKIDVGPAYVHLDVIEDKETVKDLDLPAVRADMCLCSANGYTLKPMILYGKSHDGELLSYGGSLGRCIPFGKVLIINPQVGATYTLLHTSIHLDLGGLGQIKFQEKFRSIAPYLGLEIYIEFAEHWRLCVSGQYAWSFSKTKIKDLLTCNSNSEGPAYGLLLEYDFACNWSVNVGAAYNESMSKEKNGLRGRGIKLGLARWF